MTANANDTPYDRARLTLIRSLTPPGLGPALDVGCASGETTAVLSDLGYNPVGVDIDPIAIKAASQNHPGLQFRLGDVEAAASSGPFRLIMCLEVIEHIEHAQQSAFVAQLRESLTPGGILVISTPGRWSVYSLYERARWRTWNYNWWDPTHVGIISVRQLISLLHGNSFTVTETAGFHFLPERLAAPFGTRGPLWRAGFDVIVVARLDET